MLPQSTRYLISNVRKNIKRYLFNWAFAEDRSSSISAKIAVFSRYIQYTLCNIRYWSEVVHAWCVIRLSRFINPISRIRAAWKTPRTSKARLRESLDWKFKCPRVHNPEFRQRFFCLLSSKAILFDSYQVVRLWISWNFINFKMEQVFTFFHIKLALNLVRFSIMDCVSQCLSLYLPWRLITILWKTWIIFYNYLQNWP